ncbi:MAG: sialate O-acetylesterase [Planctomycetaceae bacterium]
MPNSLRRSLAAILWFTSSLIWTATSDAADDITRVFILAGQSNMVGADANTERIDDYPEFRGAGAPQEDVLYSYIMGNGDEASKGWVALKPLRSFGPEITFARRVRNQAKCPVAIIKSAVGGTTVAFDWNPDAPEKGQKLYPRTIQLVRDSLKNLEERGIKYRLEGVLWHQGENDMLDRNLYKQYAEGLTKLIARLRSDLNAPGLKWYIAEVSEKGIWGMDHRSNLGILHQQQQQVLKADPLLRWVPTSHLAFEVMGSGQPHYHYGTQGQLQMGEAFAAAYLQEIGNPVSTVDRRFTAELPVPSKGRVRLFALVGQRNMEGEDSHVSEIQKFPEFVALTKVQDKVLFRYSLGGGVRTSRDWERLGPVDFLGSFGPELTFGASLRKAVDANEGIAIVKFTHSGAQGPDWSPLGTAETHRSLYPKLVSFLNDAQADLNRRGYSCQLEGLFWHTGENDTYFHPYLKNNAKSLKQLIEHLRTDMKRPDLPVFITEQHKNAPWRNMDEINAGLKSMAESTPGVIVIETSQLPHAKNHFGTEGTLRLGQAMSDAYLKWKKASTR